MCIIDRYLLRQFIQTFAICFISLTGLLIVFDVFTNLDQFVLCGRQTGGVLRFIAQYYAYRWMWVFDLTSGMLALVSAMFTVAWIQRHNEMTALMAAGVPRIRVLIPIIVAVGVISLVSAANRELLIPRYRREVARQPQDPLGDHARSFSPCRDNRIGVELCGKSTYARTRRIEEPNFLLMRAPWAPRDYGARLVADNAYYEPPDGNRPGGYRLEGVREPRRLDIRPSLFFNGEAVLITPHDAPDWLKPGECFLRSDLDFDQLADGKTFRQLASTRQLIAALRNPSLDYGPDVRVAIHNRIVKPLLDMTLLFLGLPLVVTRESRNVFLAMGTCLAVTVAFMITVIACQLLGETVWLSPAAAAWAPLMIFVPVAVGMAESLWK